VPALHRVRSLLTRERPALMNQMRELLAECGIIVAQGAEARTHQPDFVPQLRDLACPVVCSTARFHSHQTGLKLRYEAQQLSAPKLALKSSPVLRVDTVNPKQILSKSIPSVLISTLGPSLALRCDGSSPARQSPLLSILVPANRSRFGVARRVSGGGLTQGRWRRRRHPCRFRIQRKNGLSVKNG
jgi:hypothetical protein